MERIAESAGLAGQMAMAVPVDRRRRAQDDDLAVDRVTHSAGGGRRGRAALDLIAGVEGEPGLVAGRRSGAGADRRPSLSDRWPVGKRTYRCTGQRARSHQSLVVRQALQVAPCQTGEAEHDHLAVVRPGRLAGRRPPVSRPQRRADEQREGSNDGDHPLPARRQAGPQGAEDVAPLPAAVQEPSRRAARRPVTHLDGDLDDAGAGGDRIDAERSLQAEARRQR